jgi:hypothetical protein
MGTFFGKLCVDTTGTASLPFNPVIILLPGTFIHFELNQLNLPVLQISSSQSFPVPSGKRLHSYGKSPSLMGKLT